MRFCSLPHPLDVYQLQRPQYVKIILGTSFLKSSDEKDDSEISRRSFSETDLSRKNVPEPETVRKNQLDLSPKKSILKTSPSKQQQRQQQQPQQQSANARANLRAKDDKKIHFDLNENLQLYSEVSLVLFGDLKTFY